MKSIGYLEQRIIRLWKISKRIVPVEPHSYKKKLIYVSKKLSNFAESKNIPSALILNEYAYFLVHLRKETSFNKIYILLGSFMDSYALPSATITDEDVEYAYKIEEDWNSMHTGRYFYSSALNMLMQKSNIKIYENTFFKHDHNLRDFCLIASFVRQNRRNYPQIHGMKEFFIHLPIIKHRPGEYLAWYYTDTEKTLETYYRKVYGNTLIKDRFDNFSEFQSGNDSLNEFGDVWGVKEMQKCRTQVE